MAEAEFILDWDRQSRTGLGEAVYCAGKPIALIEEILRSARAGDKRLLLTRLSAARHAELAADLRAALDYDAPSGTATLGPTLAATRPGVGIVCAGASDLPVAREAARALAFHGFAAPLTSDVGVAGLWRLLERIEGLRAHRVIIAVAGMEGALFSVLGGLVGALVIAVPTSVGYGVAAEGKAALAAALASCAPGVVTVNVDNGYGAACAAIKILGNHPGGNEAANE